MYILRCTYLQFNLKPIPQPSFPVDEKRRILELFKERKKNRRKKGLKKVASSYDTDASASASAVATSSTNASINATSTVSSGGSWKANAPAGSGEHVNKNVYAENMVSKSEHSDSKEDVSITTVEGSGREEDDMKLNDDLLIEHLSSMSTTKKKKKKKKMKRQLSVDSVGESGPSSPSKRQDLVQGSNNENDSTQNTKPKDKQHLVEELGENDANNENHSMPPPGFDESLSSLALDDNASQTNCNRQLSGSLTNHQLSLDTPISSQQKSHTIQPHPQHEDLKSIGSRFIVISEQDRPMLPSMPLGDPPGLSSQPPPKTSLAIAAAKVFVDLYYQHITLGLSSDLAKYYTPHAQKSISVGGAHSVVATRADIMLQLQSLARSNFIVRGVVSQDSFDCQGAHILVTGVVHTNGVMTQFAHAISLVPVPQHSHYSFQIHNDALSLLANSDDSQNNRSVQSRHASNQ